MSSQTGRNDPCGCGSGKKYKNCCGPPKGIVADMRAKDVKYLEWTLGLAQALAASLDRPYLEYFTAAGSGGSQRKRSRTVAEWCFHRM